MFICRIAGYFREGKFSQIVLFQLFESEIFTDCLDKYTFSRVKFSQIELDT